MKQLQQLGIVLFLLGIFTFSSAIFMGTFSPTKAQLTALMTEKGISSKVFESNAVAFFSVFLIFLTKQMF